LKEKLIPQLRIQGITAINPGYIYTIEGKKYRGFTPNYYKRVIYPDPETERPTIGRYRKTYLLPIEIYELFNNFTERGHPATFLLGRAMGFWKSMAILSHFPTFNINNFIGDSFTLALQTKHPFSIFSNFRFTLDFLSNPQKYPDYNNWIIEQQILDSSFIKTEIPLIQGTKDPVSYILNKSRDVSEFRENILRSCLAKYIYDNLQKGKAQDIIKEFNLIDVEGLNEEEALGKIAREVLFDYWKVSKTYRAIIKNGFFPFGFWYAEGTKRVFQSIWKHPLRTLGLLALPMVASVVWNNSDEERKEQEKYLPEGIRQRPHFILGENPDGTVRVFSLNLPGDAWFGTKIFSIAIDQANRVATGEKTLKQAVQDTIKITGEKEYRGVKYLTNFLWRFIEGSFTGIDPYFKTPIYPKDSSKLTGRAKAWHTSQFFIECSSPMLSGYLSSYRLNKPIDTTIKRIIENYIGLPALGIRDYDKKAFVKFGDKTMDWNEMEKMKDLYRLEETYLAEAEGDFLRSGLNVTEYLSSKKFSKLSEKVKEDIPSIYPDFLTKLTRRFFSPQILSVYYKNKAELEKNPEVARRYRMTAGTFQKIQIIKNMQQLKKFIPDYFEGL